MTMSKNIVCPRCEGFIPCNELPGKYPGAISRVDDLTEICSDCGTEEAIFPLFPIEQWPITTIDHRHSVPAVHRFTNRLDQILEGAES